MEEIFQYDIIDQMFYEGYAPKVHNCCYGGFRWSKDAEDIMRELQKTMSYKTQPLSFFKDMNIQISFINAKVITYLERNQIEHSGKYSQLDFSFVKMEYYDSIDVQEYDGNEYLEFNFDRYFRKTTLDIIKDLSLFDDQKIEAIKNIKEEDIQKVIIDREEVTLEQSNLPPVVKL